MEQAELNKLTNWLYILQEVAKVYQGNCNLDTVIRSIEARISNHNKK